MNWSNARAVNALSALRGLPADSSMTSDARRRWVSMRGWDTTKQDTTKVRILEGRETTKAGKRRLADTAGCLPVVVR
jgi:hypothetical protein